MWLVNMYNDKLLHFYLVISMAFCTPFAYVDYFYNFFNLWNLCKIVIWSIYILCVCIRETIIILFYCNRNKSIPIITFFFVLTVFFFNHFSTKVPHSFILRHCTLITRRIFLTLLRLIFVKETKVTNFKNDRITFYNL